MRRFAHHVVWGGLLGFGLHVTVLLMVADVLVPGGQRSGPLQFGWWIVYPLLWIVTSLVYAAVRGLARAGDEGAAEPAARRTRRRLIAGAVAFAVFLLGLVSGGTYHWDGGYRVARYSFRVVDSEGRPLVGAAMRVRGPVRRTRERDWGAPAEADGRSPRLDGFWPIFEFGGEPLRTGADGRLVVHQRTGGLQFSGNGVMVFGLSFDINTTKPDHEIEFTLPGHRGRVLDFDDLDRRARGGDVESRVVLRPIRE